MQTSVFSLSWVLCFVFIAIIFGGIIGWWLRKYFVCRHLHTEKNEIARQQQLVANLRAENNKIQRRLNEVTKPKAIDIAVMEVEQIEGIGKGYGKRLRAMGIETVDDMLEKGLTAEGRKAIAETTKLSRVAVDSWVSIADLMRVPGAGKHFSELLEACGVRSVEILRAQNAKALAGKMKAVNAAQRITTEDLPIVEQVAEWISASQEIAVRLNN